MEWLDLWSLCGWGSGAVVPVAAVGEGGDDQTWCVAQVFVTIGQTSVDHLDLQLVFLLGQRISYTHSYPPLTLLVPAPPGNQPPLHLPPSSSAAGSAIQSRSHHLFPSAPALPAHPWHERPPPPRRRESLGSVWTVFHVRVRRCLQSAYCSAPGRLQGPGTKDKETRRQTCDTKGLVQHSTCLEQTVISVDQTATDSFSVKHGRYRCVGFSFDLIWQLQLHSVCSSHSQQYVYSSVSLQLRAQLFTQ